MDDDVYYVYGLIDPRCGQYFYIGKGKNNRAWDHINKIDKINKRKQRLIDDIKAENLMPEVKIIQEQLSNSVALNLEIELIKKYGRRHIDENGLLTNLTSGGEGGDTSMFFTEESYRKMKTVGEGCKNSMAKLTEQQVIEIYHSTENLLDLSVKYGISKPQLTALKQRIYYKNITKDIKVMPGVYAGGKKCRQIIPVDLIPTIYKETGTYMYFHEKYNITPVVVRNIKKRKSHTKYTNNLGFPGEIARYNLTPDNIFEIRESTKTLEELSNVYGVHIETIRNIRKGNTRQFSDGFYEEDYL